MPGQHSCKSSSSRRFDHLPILIDPLNGIAIRICSIFSRNVNEL